MLSDDTGNDDDTADQREGATARINAPPLTFRTALLAAALLLPMLGLALLIAQPQWDVTWQHHPAHFWLILGVSAVNFVLAFVTGSAARQRLDARVFLISLGFLAAAGFFGLHALVTPGVLMDGPNAGFNMASPAGLLLASVFAAASSINLNRERAATVMRNAQLLRALLIGLMVVWALFSILELPPLNEGVEASRGSRPLLAVSLPGVILYGFAVVRYLRLARRAASAALPAALAAAFVLLAEAEIAIAASRNWHASWWEWHLLMLAAFGLIAMSAHRQWHEERFASLYLEDTAAGTREISVLFADLQGFTSFSEKYGQKVVSTMLNEYFAVAIPQITERFGGQVERIIGDALMVTFNIRGDQPDHARRAAQAALAMQQVTDEVADRHPEWPRFRIGVNSGEAMMSVVGTTGGRTYTVLGDAVNLASRFEGMAGAGEVVIGAETARQLAGAQLEMLGEFDVKGVSEPVVAYRLRGL